MKFDIEISDREVKAAILEGVETAIYQTVLDNGGAAYVQIIEQCVREIIYKGKDEIMDRVVERVSQEYRNKAVKKAVG